MTTQKIQLGDVARDTITGFKGTVIARTQWLTGCERLTLQPLVDKEGKVPDCVSFDEPTCVLVKSRNPAAPPKSTTGGPRPEPVKR